ncbi:hypothetical protein C8R47DRAFT_1224858 [Mycena vitilis]|nr:hypothetical protein C8R47DRAFT_1224858 [Mycena vitilis]
MSREIAGMMHVRFMVGARSRRRLEAEVSQCAQRETASDVGASEPNPRRSREEEERCDFHHITVTPLLLNQPPPHKRDAFVGVLARGKGNRRRQYFKRLPSIFLPDTVVASFLAALEAHGDAIPAPNLPDFLEDVRVGGLDPCFVTESDEIPVCGFNLAPRLLSSSTVHDLPCAALLCCPCPCL